MSTKPVPTVGQTGASIRAGSLRSILPELYNLSTRVENQPWHTTQDVLSHSITALESTDQLLLNLPKLKGQLNTNFEALRLAALLHDIGKLEAFITHTDGHTSCPNHGPVGERLAGPILKRLGLDIHTINYVSRLVSDHLLGCDLLEIAFEAGRPVDWTGFIAEHPANTIELIILAYADTAACQYEPLLEAQVKFRLDQAYRYLTDTKA